MAAEQAANQEPVEPEDEDEEEIGGEETLASSEDDEEESQSGSDDDDDAYYSADEQEEELYATDDPRAKVLSVLELEDLFIKMAPDLSGKSFLTLFWSVSESVSSLCRFRRKNTSKTCRRTCWLSQRWQVKHDKLSSGREKG